MTAEPSEKKTGKILTPAEREFCKKIAAQGDGLNSQRAEVLLLVDEGITQANACTTSALSIGQLRYALTLFRNTGMHMFPKETTAPIAAEETVLIEPEEPVEETVLVEPEVPAEEPAEEVIEPTEPMVKSVKEKKDTKSPKKKKKSKDKKKKKMQQEVDKPKKKKKDKKTKKKKVQQQEVAQPKKTKKKKAKKK